MTLSNYRVIAKGRYALTRSTDEDPEFTDDVLDDIINEKHRWFSSVAMCYYVQDYYEPLVVGKSGYSGDARVLEIDDSVVVVQTAASTFTKIPRKIYRELVIANGPLQVLAASTPTAFYPRTGGEFNDQSRMIELVPAPSTSTAGAGTTTTEALDTTETGVDVTSTTGINKGMQITIESEKMLVLAVTAGTPPAGTLTVIRGHNLTTPATHASPSNVSWNLHNLIYGAWLYPATLSADSDRPPLPVSEHDRLIPAICWGMAQLDKSRGRSDAGELAAMWEKMAYAEAMELFEIHRRVREPQRTAQVGPSPLADAEQRRAPKLAR